MKTSLVRQIASMDNLMLAWRKIENLFVPGDIWFDPLRLTAFKYRLKENLEQISQNLENGTYRLSCIKPVPFPKKKGDEDDVPPIRQSFIIDVADQLVWVAVCNVIGARLDTRMPAWSYGNRLYMYWWKDAADKWQIGNYRNSTPTLYRNWNQSWPQMKRRITVSLKKMSFTGELDEVEEEVLQQEQDTKFEYAKLKYLKPDYFDQFNGNPTDTLYWMGLDLTKFYPHVSILKTKEIIIRELKATDDAPFMSLLSTLCAFELDVSDYHGKEEDLALMGFEDLEEASFMGLPTGLLVSGFLANVFMLDIDRFADKYLDQHHDVIHFRYVDDHVIVGRTPEATKQWVEAYVKVLKDYGLEINVGKAEPKGILNQVGDAYVVDAVSLSKVGAIDSFYPTPLMTQTLQKVSMLSKEKLPLLSGSEFNLVLKDLQAMLVTDIPETEIKKATRISFACTMLSRMMRDGQVDYHEVYATRRYLYDKFSQNNNLSETKKKEYQKWLFRDDFALSKEEMTSLKPDEQKAFLHLQELIEAGDKKTETLARTIFGLLMRSLNEVPDKVKIWVRAFLFAVNHYPEGIRTIKRQLKKIKSRGALHHLSVLYLESIIEFLSTEAILDIICHLYLDNYCTAKDRMRDEQALELLLAQPYPDEGFQFKRISSRALMEAQAVYQKHSELLDLKPIEDFIPPSVDYKYDDGLVLDTTFWEIWKMENIEMEEGRLKVAKELVSARNVRAGSPFFEGYLYKVLSIFTTFNEEDNELLPSNSDLRDVSSELEYAIRMFDTKGKYLQWNPPVRPKHKGWISLYEWISQTDLEITKLLRKESGVARKELMNRVQYHEIFRVKLMLEIAKRVQEVIGKDTGAWDNRRLHPMNIYLNREALKNPQWQIIDEQKTIQVELFDDDLSGAEAFYETKDTSPIVMPIYFTVCYGLGLNFLHLLTGKMYFPWIMNNPNYGYEWRRELNKLLNKGEVSSINYKIVEACLSIWNRESVFLQKALPELFQEDKSQSIEIRDLSDLVEWLERSLQQMKNNVISVPDHQYRQLIEISVE